MLNWHIYQPLCFTGGFPWPTHRRKGPGQLQRRALRVPREVHWGHQAGHRAPHLTSVPVGWFLDDFWMIFGWFLDDFWMIVDDFGWFLDDSWMIFWDFWKILEYVWMLFGWFWMFLEEMIFGFNFVIFGWLLDDCWMIVGWLLDEFCKILEVVWKISDVFGCFLDDCWWCLMSFDDPRWSWNVYLFRWRTRLEIHTIDIWSQGLQAPVTTWHVLSSRSPGSIAFHFHIKWTFLIRCGYPKSSRSLKSSIFTWIMCSCESHFYQVLVLSGWICPDLSQKRFQVGGHLAPRCRGAS